MTRTGGAPAIACALAALLATVASFPGSVLAEGASPADVPSGTPAPAPLPRGTPGPSVLVEVVDAEGGEPLAGAFLSLLDGPGRVIDQALTGDDGTFRFRLPGEGAYRVRAELIGRETRTSEAFGPGAADAGIRLSLPRLPISLAEIRVEAEPRCRLRPEEATELAGVWDEARKTLRVQAWTEREALYRLDVSTWERDLDARAIRVVREERRRATVTRAPFASLPVEELERTGFVRVLEDGSYAWLGPDADVLLSDLFLDGHCFRLERADDRPGTLGLAFAPVERRERGDVEGTLWLDEATGDLETLEFEYTWAPWPEARGIAGGRVEFRRMPTGAVIVDRWWIRAPLLGRMQGALEPGDRGVRVTGVRESGGEVLDVRAPGERRAARGRRGSVEGVVWDSTRAAPLSGATVYLSGTGHRTDADAEGRFLVEDVVPGRYTLAFAHPRLDSLGVVSPAADVEVSAGVVAEAPLAIPSLATLRLAACREEGAGAVLTGVVRQGRAGAPVPGAAVRIVPSGAGASGAPLRVTAGPEGRYVACGVPVGVPLSVRASLVEVEGVAAAITVPEGGHRELDLVIALPRAAEADVRPSGAVEGVQGVQGVVVDPTTGRPVPGAEVVLRRLAGGAPRTALTDDRGFFRFRTPEPGTHLLSASALGYAALVAGAVEVDGGSLTVLEVALPPRALELEPLIATAEARSFHLEMEGYYDRAEQGLGVFIGPERLERRPPRRVTDLFVGMPGARVQDPRAGHGSRRVAFRVGERLDPERPCWPVVWIDRHVASDGGFDAFERMGPGTVRGALDDFLAAPDLLAVEVYRRAAEVPPEFNTPHAACGVIVVWTRRGSAR